MVFEGEVAKIVKAFGIILCFGFFCFATLRFEV